MCGVAEPTLVHTSYHRAVEIARFFHKKTPASQKRGGAGRLGWWAQRTMEKAAGTEQEKKTSQERKRAVRCAWDALEKGVRKEEVKTK